MGLLQIIKEQKLKDNSRRVLLLGLDNSGKTTVLNQLLNEPIDKIQPTIGFQIKTLKLSNKVLQMWDIGGQKTLRPFWFNYFEKTDYLIWVIDILDNRLMESLTLLEEIVQENDRINLQFEVFILLNKIDLLPKGNGNSLNDDDALQKKVDHVKRITSRALQMDPESVRVIPTSGVNGTGLDQLITLLEDK
ncbi:Cin4 [Kluyveromyces lactis]|nr:Cin4 [Kluyveromyces lactis]